MAKNQTSSRAMAEPTGFQRLDSDDPKMIQVIIETPTGSRNKYAFDPKQKIRRRNE